MTLALVLLFAFADTLHLPGPGPVSAALALDASGRPTVTASLDGRTILTAIADGFDGPGSAPLAGPFEVVAADTSSTDYTWQTVWGAAAEVRNRYSEARWTLRQRAAPHDTLGLTVRVYADAVAFRLSFFRVAITDELTRLTFPEDAEAFWLPLDFDDDEKLYRRTPLAAVSDANTPLTLRYRDGTHVVVHEAHLENYPGMALRQSAEDPLAFEVALAGRDAVKGRFGGPAETPWRVALITRRATALIESATVLNLNPPCAICDGDLSWLRPGTYVGVWWSIHKGQHTWAPGPDVGATTERAMAYVDFAAEHGIPYVLVEGWNEGWGGPWSEMDFTRPHAGYDLKAVAAYAHERGVGLMAHVETGANPDGFERQLDEAFALFQRLGIHAVKTGYVGEIPGHHHADQRMVEHSRMVARRAAAYGLMVNAHEPVKSTGEERTYPNFVTREGARGMEWNAWSDGNPPGHSVTLPFTRLLAGPLDYTPGVFVMDWAPERAPESPFAGGPHRRVHSTRARQLAKTVVYLSGVQMLADVPEHYRGVPEFAFLREVPATWDETRALAGEVGAYVAVARRSGADWYLGAMTDETARTLTLPLAFLGPGRFRATVYADGPNADFRTDPHPVTIQEREVEASGTLALPLAPGGGAAVRLTPMP